MTALDMIANNQTYIIAAIKAIAKKVQVTEKDIEAEIEQTPQNIPIPLTDAQLEPAIDHFAQQAAVMMNDTNKFDEMMASGEWDQKISNNLLLLDEEMLSVIGIGVFRVCCVGVLF